MVAFVGAGGKTTAIVRMTDELSQMGVPVVATTTTRVGRSMSTVMPVVQAPAGRLGERLDAALARHGRVLLTGGEGPEGKFVGVEVGVLDELAAARSGHVFLVEADGARGRSIKAPADHEPVIPKTVSVVVPVAGLNAIGKPLDDRVAHRPALVAALHDEATVTPELITAVMLSERGGLKNAPRAAAVRPLLNRIDEVDPDVAARVAGALLARSGGRVQRVVLSDLLTQKYCFVEEEPSGPA